MRSRTAGAFISFLILSSCVTPRSEPLPEPGDGDSGVDMPGEFEPDDGGDRPTPPDGGGDEKMGPSDGSTDMGSPDMGSADVPPCTTPASCCKGCWDGTKCLPGSDVTAC